MAIEVLCRALNRANGATVKQKITAVIAELDGMNARS
jgi:hypothetical protein